MSELSKQALVVDNNQSFPNNNNGAITPSVLRAFNTNMIDSTVNQTQYTADSGSFNAQITALEVFTASFTGSTVDTGSLLVTASFNNGTRNLTFTKGDATTFNVNIPDVSGSTFNTGSFATTGSNTFIGNQIISGNVLPQVDGQGDLGTDTFKWNTVVVNGQLKGSSINTTGRGTVGTIRVGDESFPLSFLADREIVGDGTGANTHMYYATSSTDVNGLREFVYAQSGSDANFTSVSASFNTRILAITGSGGSGGGATLGENTFTGSQTISTTGNSQLIISSSSGGQSNILLKGTLTNNLTAFGGQLLINNNGQSGGSGSIGVVTSRNQIDLAADSGVAIGPTNGAGNGIATGAIRLLAQSGSLVLTNNSYTNTSASLSHLSASDNTLLANFIFRANSNSGTTQISGSGNIFTNPTTPTAGRINYVGGATNLFLNGQSANLPQITGSAASVSGNRPTMNSNYIAGPHAWTINQAPNPGTHTYSNNIIAGIGQWNFNMLGNTGVVNINNNLGLGSNMTINSPSRSIAEINAGASGSTTLQIQNNSIQGFIQYQGPVSASSHQINQNIIAGNLTLNVQSQSRAIGVTGNIINGTMTMNDNTVFAPTLGTSHGIQNNNINGSFILNQRASSSINLLNNNINTWTLSNDFDASSITTATSRLLVLNGNILFGSGNNLYASGSNEANSFTRGFNSNLFGGLAISASVVANGGNSNMISTIGVGQSLHVVGTSRRDASNTTGAAATQGSAFFGRFNKEGQGFNTTAEVILAVGTGTSGSAGITRKTGFLIDSGSNSFFEGAVNVSGSLTVQSGSTFFANGNQQFNVGAFSSLVTQSGSAGVSQSVNFDTTDISSGVSIASNSRITLANSGTYSLTFSAQIKADGGQDTVWMWLKKNGTNVPNTSTKIVGKNNEETVLTVNYVVDAVATDYYELAWENLNGYGDLLYEVAGTNYPAIPSVILTVTQVK
jgi:hypothetical protein